MINAKYLFEVYTEAKNRLKEENKLTPEQIDYYLLGWIDCSLKVLKEVKND